MTKTFEDYQEEMNPCYKNYNAFKDKKGEICYIPENAESLEDAFTYSDLKNEVIVWSLNNEDYLIEHETTLEAILANMFENLSWEFPSTFLDQLDY
jgi:hypothetical protein